MISHYDFDLNSSERDGNTRPPDLTLEKSVCRSGSNRQGHGHGTTDGFQIGKGIHQGCILSPCLFNLFADNYRFLSVTNRWHETTDWFQIGKGVCQGCILSLCLFNLYAEYIMRNAGLEEVQAGIKIAGRDINNLRL